jgi:rubredoxin
VIEKAKLPWTIQEQWKIRQGKQVAKPEEMYQCQTVNCGNPDRGDRKGKIPKGTQFEDLPASWCCPVCGASKEFFRPCAGPGSAKEQG